MGREEQVGPKGKEDPIAPPSMTNANGNRNPITESMGKAIQDLLCGPCSNLKAAGDRKKNERDQRERDKQEQRALDLEAKRKLDFEKDKQNAHKMKVKHETSRYFKEFCAKKDEERR